MDKITNPYCIVNYFYWEVWGKYLNCYECPMECPCKHVRIG